MKMSEFNFIKWNPTNLAWSQLVTQMTDRLGKQYQGDDKSCSWVYEDMVIAAVQVKVGLVIHCAVTLYRMSDVLQHDAEAGIIKKYSWRYAE